MATLIRSMFVAALAAFLFPFLPAFASAQQVHEVRPAGADEVRIGVHGPASMEAVVALARRITGNPALTADDVIANLPHARRYVCRVRGRQVYFGPDPDYGGRCPDDGVRTDGVLRGATYRIPREHGVVLAPPVGRRVRRATSPASDEASQRRIAELESRLAAVTAERDAARRERDQARERDAASESAVNQAESAQATAEAQRDAAIRERDEARAALAARPPAPIVVSVPGLRGRAERETITFASRLHGVPVWAWLAVAALLVLAVAFIAFGLVILPREKRPLAERLDELEDAKTKVEGEFMAKKVEADEASQDLAQAKRRIASLRAAGNRAIRMGKRLFEESRASAEAHRALKEDEERAATKLIEYQNRKERIAGNHAKLMALREEEEPFLYLETLLRETETDRELARERGDMGAVAQYEQALAIYRERLESSGDASHLRAEIAGLAAVLARDIQLQCGIAFDARSADERLTYWEDLRREELRRAAAECKHYGTLVSLLEERELARVAEITSKRRALESEFASKEGALEGRHWLYASAKHDAEESLRAATRELAEMRASLDEHKSLVDAFAGDPSAHAQALLQRDGVIADLAKRLREAGINPGKLPVTPANGTWPEEEATEELPLPGRPGTPAFGTPRRPRTLAAEASPEALQAARDSQLPAPPKSPLSAVNRAIYKLLDDFELLPPDAWTILCEKEEEAADWAFLVARCAISAPRIGEVPLRKLMTVVERRAPEWLDGRMRRRTDPPPAPSMT